MDKNVTGYLVGGVVRDALLNKTNTDIDIALNGDTHAIGTDLAKLFDGTLIVLDELRKIVRVSMGTKDGVIDLKPIEGPDIYRDLSCRDFTVDAMAIPIPVPNGNWNTSGLIDPHNGTVDLKNGVIRALSQSVFDNDPARLLRAPRLAAQLGFHIDMETALLIRNHANMLTQVSSERIRDEFLGLLSQPEVSNSLRELDRLGLLYLIIPELSDTQGVSQPKEHHWDVFEHLIESAGHVETLLLPQSPDQHRLRKSMPLFDGSEEHFALDISDGHNRLTMLKLAGLLHDIAKPATKTIEQSGKIRFLGHPQMGAEMSKEILSRLRVSGKGVDFVGRMVKHHLRPSQMAQAGELPTSRAVYRYYRELGDVGIDNLYLNMADYLAARGPQLEIKDWNAHCRVIGHILYEGLKPSGPKRLPKLIDGKELMEVFSLAPGPQLGSLLELVRESQASGEVGSKKEAISLIRIELNAGGSSA